MASFLLVHHHGSKMLRSESNSSITQSPIGWQISHFLSLLHEPTSGMCVCTSECVLLVLVLVCTTVAAWASAHCEWHPHEPAPLTTITHSAQAGFHACSCLCESLHLLSLSLRHAYGTRRAKLAPFSLSQHVTSTPERSFFSGFQVCLTVKQTSVLRPFERL